MSGAREGRALLLANRRASRHGAALDAGVAALEAAGVAVVREEPDDPAAIPARVREARGFDRIVLAGGDGTIHRALPALLERGLPLGVVPLGTANDLARSLALPRDPAEACAVIARGHVRRIDLGRVGDRPFANTASFGLSARLTRRLDADRKRRFGVLAYALAALETVRTARPFRVTLRCDDGVHHVRALQVGVSNGRHYGGGMTVHVDKDVSDRRLDVFAIEARGLLGLLRLLPRLRLGWTDDAPGLRLVETRSVHVETSRPLRIDADGELVAWTPARFDVLPAALPVFAPGEAAPTAADGMLGSGGEA